MIWKITHLNENKFTNIEDNSIINIGNMMDCHIKLNLPSENSIFIQIILEENYIFTIIEKIVSIKILFNQFKFLNHEFIIEACESFNERIHFNYQETQDISSSQEFLNYLSIIQKKLSESKNFVNNNFKLSKDEVIETILRTIENIFWENRNIFDPLERKRFKKFLTILSAQISDYGILSLPLLDPSVSEIMVNDSKHIYLEKNGVISLSPLQFNSDQELFSIIERICSSMGRRIDESIPYCDARLKDGSRVHAIIPPLALNGPCLTIRKFPKHEITPYKLLELGSLTEEMFHFLQEIVMSKKNILISGGTGSGKTTLLNCLTYFIPENERVITIEDSAELKLQQKHVIRLESRSENIEKKGQVTLRDLVRNSLRMRPDRIIIGECRGGEALDMLQAMNTGHDGSMTTVHANSPKDALRRLETLVLFAEFDLPSRAVREQISSAVQYVVQQTRFSSGKRCVSEIHKIIGLCDRTSQFLTESIFCYSDL